MKNESTERTVPVVDIHDRCYQFSLAIVNLAQHIDSSLINKPLVGQLVRAATSISANLYEASLGSSRKDFVNKVSIALRESAETLYWLRLLCDSGYLSSAVANSHIQEADEIIRILAKIKINAQAHT